jgi:predicted acetyltransferase
MTALVRPAVRYADSWIETVEDFDGADRMHGSGHWNLGRVDPTPAGCEAFVTAVLSAECADRHGTRVASTYYWIVDSAAGAVLGFLNLRHELNDFLLEEGGHIGYSIRPARRREGHAGRALALAVRRAADLGLDRVLLTCDDDNDASRRTIERNGGVLEDVRGIKRRYWIAVP